MGRPLKVRLALLAIAGACAGTASADTVLSVTANTPHGKFGPGTNGQNQFGQTITVPADNVLKSFSLSIATLNGSFTFTGAVAKWDGFKATGPLLYQSANMSASVNTFTFAPNLTLTPNAQYVLFLNTTAGTGTVGLGGNDTNPYSGGMVASADITGDPTLGTGNWSVSTGVDLEFTAAFAAPAPLPGVAVGGLTLLTGVAVARVRRRLPQA
jgi:hypothetical protein